MSLLKIATKSKTFVFCLSNSDIKINDLRNLKRTKGKSFYVLSPRKSKSIEQFSRQINAKLFIGKSGAESLKGLLKKKQVAVISNTHNELIENTDNCFLLTTKTAPTPVRATASIILNFKDIAQLIEHIFSIFYTLNLKRKPVLSKSRYISKPWGYEEILANTKCYVLKKLVIKKGLQLSLQYHKNKIESIYVVKGKMKLISLNKEFSLSKGMSFTLQNNTIHRFKALTDVIVIEASTKYLDDVVRLDDDYDRY